MKLKLAVLCALAVTCSAQTQTPTPNIGLQVPAFGTSDWHIPMDYDLNLLDTLLSGNQAIPALTVTGNVLAANLLTTTAYQGAWSSTTTYLRGQTVLSNNAVYVALLSANLNNPPASSPLWWNIVVPQGVGSAATWGQISGTLANQTDLVAQFSAKQATGNYITALTGDLAAAGPGSSAATLATVNGAPGSCGDATHVCVVTTNGKGLVTGQAATAITTAGTGTVTSLSDPVIPSWLTASYATRTTTPALTIAAATAQTPHQVIGTCGAGTTFVPCTLLASDIPAALGSTTSVNGTAIPASSTLVSSVVNPVVPSWLSSAITTATTTPAITITAATGQTPHQVIGTCGAGTTFVPCTLLASDIPVSLGSTTSVNGTAIPAAATLMTTSTALTAGQEPAHTGDMTNTAGSLATTVGAIGGKSVSLAGSLTTAGAFGLTLTTTALTNVTLPVSGTLMNTSTVLTAGQEPAHTGDVTNTQGSLALTLATVNGSPGACGDSTHVCAVTTNGKGLVTSQTATAIAASGGTVTSVVNPVVPSWLTSSILTATTTPAITLAPTTAQTPHQVIGTCGAGTTFVPCTLLASDIPATLGSTTSVNGTTIPASSTLMTNSTVLTAGQSPAHTGDVTNSAGSLALTLATVNGAPGACGDGTHVCAVTTNGKGLVTSQTATAITNQGTVTSVGNPAVPSWLSSSIATATTTPAITLIPATAQTSHQVIGTCGAGTTFVPCSLVAADIPTLNQNTTGTAANVTGTVAIANGGTGAITAPAALTALGAAPLASPAFTGTATAVNLTVSGTCTGCGASGNITVLNAGTSVGSRSALNFINGTGIGNLTIADNSGAGRIDITVPIDPAYLTTAIQATQLATPSVGNTPLVWELANNGGTGTTINKSVTVTGSPATAILATVSSTTGLIGCSSSSTATTGNAKIAAAGTLTCTSDGAVAATHWMAKSGTVDGAWHDNGTVAPSGACLIALTTIGSAGTFQAAVPLPGQCGGAVLASSETVSFSATPTFSLATRASILSSLTGNVTSFTLAAGQDGQEKTLTFCQDATGGRTVTPPSNVHGFFLVGAILSKCSSQHFTYYAAQTAWLADSPGVLNQ